MSWYGDKSANWDTTTVNWNYGASLYTEAAGVGDNVTFYDDLEPTALRTNVTLTAAMSPS